LGNIILNKDTGEVTLANFCLGKHLTSDNDLLKDQRGSPAYISPDVITGKPYLGKQFNQFFIQHGNLQIFALIFQPRTLFVYR